MFYVYLLKSEYNGSLYIGFTPDLKERFAKHNKGLVESTKRYLPWKLVYYESLTLGEQAALVTKSIHQG